MPAHKVPLQRFEALLPSVGISGESECYCAHSRRRKENWTASWCPRTRQNYMKVTLLPVCRRRASTGAATAAQASWVALGGLSLTCFGARLEAQCCLPTPISAPRRPDILPLDLVPNFVSRVPPNVRHFLLTLPQLMVRSRGVVGCSYVNRLRMRTGARLGNLRLRKLLAIQASDDADRIASREMIQD